ncbi:MAG: DUF359 domain-containing protein [Candidatus Verstraetearchaeota archaeon]|nr:DUF359 domain-containing protein [Candidatus Verstraetearchaeota archaeon]
MGLLKLPEELRLELSKCQGKLLSGTPRENVANAVEHVRSKSPPKVVVVGDFTLREFIDFGFLPDVAIFDNRSRRSEFRQVGLSPTAVVRNPPGTITDEAISSIRDGLASDRQSAILVEGEEDLLALPAILLSPVGSIVVYGIPGIGMAIVEATPEMKEKVKAMLEKFERVE